jgi:hypothetical protein
MSAKKPFFVDLLKVETLQNQLLAVLEEPSNRLTEAIQKTVDEQLFQREDVFLALNHLKGQLKNGELYDWAKQSLDHIEKVQTKKIIDTDSYKIVALLAGNLPLVGLQDVLALILFGASACVKLSKKDPYLIPALLVELEEKGGLTNLKWSTNLDNFKNFKATRALFTGDEKNLAVVKSKLIQENIIQPTAPILARKAGVSVCFVIDVEILSETAISKAIEEAIFAYEGKGCRSVGVIVHSNNISFEMLTEQLGDILVSNKEIAISEQLQYDKAFLTACGFKTAFINGMLFTSDTTAWQEVNKVVLINEHDWLLGSIPDNKIQSYYVLEKKNLVNQRHAEMIQTAQRPPLFWRPDGIDTLAWLI